MALEAVDYRVSSPVPFNLLFVCGGCRLHAFRDERSELFNVSKSLDITHAGMKSDQHTLNVSRPSGTTYVRTFFQSIT